MFGLRPPIRKPLELNWLMIGLSLIVLFVTAFSLRSDTSSDPKFTLIVSQSIIENRSIHLDDYQEKTVLGKTFFSYVNGRTLIEHDGHYYSYFPTGPSVLMVPVVWGAMVFGQDMLLAKDNYDLQKSLAAVSSVIMLWLVYAIARTYLEKGPSLIIAGISVLGSGLVSTLGSALWTLNFSAVLIGLSLLLIVRYDSGKSTTCHPILLGLLLFLGYFSRASTAAFIIPVLIYLLVKDRQQFITTSLTGLALLVLFVGWSYLEYGQFLPPYYSLRRFDEALVPLWVAIYGHLVSPSRGVFPFSPFLLLIIPGLILFRHQFWRRPLIWLCLGWFTLQVIISSRAVIWWGGSSFGPRILTDAILALILLTILIWNEAKSALKPPMQNIVIGAYIALGIVSIFFHSYQGLYNRHTGRWNSYIELLPTPPFSGLGDLFNWRYAQFIATSETLCRIQEDHIRGIIPFDITLIEYQFGDLIPYDGDTRIDFREAATFVSIAQNPPPTPDPSAKSVPTKDAIFLPFTSNEMTPSNKAFFIGWSQIEESLPYRWTECKKVSIVFRLGDRVSKNEKYILKVSSGSFGRQDVILFLNGHILGEFSFGDHQTSIEEAVFEFSGDYLKPSDFNEVEIQIPGAKYAGYSDQRLLGLSFREMAIYPADAYPPTPLILESPDPTPYP